jgi:hypothetical protein
LLEIIGKPLADFQVPHRGWQRVRAGIIHAAMYTFFRTVAKLEAHCVTPPDRFLRSCGFQLEERRTSEWGLLHDAVRTDNTRSGLK